MVRVSVAIQTLEEMLRACVLDFGGSWDVWYERIKGTDKYDKDTENKAKTTKPDSEWKKTSEGQVKSKPESQSSQKVNRKVNWSKSKSTPKPKSQQIKKYKFKG
ncbi:hypothetical protein Tco_1302495 [Tanacetum coccineum]